MKRLFTAFALLGLLFASCGGGETSKTIKDEKLYPFLLGGVYFFNGYDGVESFSENLAKGQMSSKPGDKGFLNELQSIYDNYFIYPFDKSDARGASSMLKQGWGVTDKASFDETQANLLAKGHQASFVKYKKAIDENGGAAADLSTIDMAKYDIDDEERLAFVKENYDKFSASGIRAWDFARYVNNLCMGYAAGYVTEEEGHELLKKVVPMAQEVYSDWNTYFADWSLGRGFWSGEPSDTDFDAVVAGIADATNDYNIYNYVAFK